MPESLKQEDSPTKASHLAYYAGEVQLQSSHFYILTEQQCDNRATVSTASHAYLLISTCLSISTIAKGDRVPLRLRCICHCCAGSPWLPEFIRLIDGCLCLSRCGLQDYAPFVGLFFSGPTLAHCRCSTASQTDDPMPCSSYQVPDLQLTTPASKQGARAS